MTQICVNTDGCRPGMNGSCFFCNYPRSDAIMEERFIKPLAEALKTVEKDDMALLVGSSGSILDHNEVPESALRTILSMVSKTDVPQIIVETGIQTIDDESLRMLYDTIGEHTVDIEMGLESSNPEVLKYCLGKNIRLDDFASKADLIHSYGFKTTVNVLVGAPFLSAEEQIYDAVATITWALNNGADDAVLFPMSVRKGTVVEMLYQRGIYSPIDLSAIPYTLCSIEANYLDRISVSWADPEQVDDVRILARPRDNGCESLYGLISEFMRSRDRSVRKRLVTEMLDHCSPCP